MISTGHHEFRIYPAIFPAEIGFRPSPYRGAGDGRKQAMSHVARTIFQETVLRDIANENLAAPLIIGSERDSRAIGDQLRGIDDGLPHILVDHAARNTGLATALAAIWLALRDPNALMLVEPSDHIFRSSQAFRTAIGEATSAALQGHFVSFAVKPIAFEPGRRYLRAGRPLEGCPGVCTVEKFVEDGFVADPGIVDPRAPLYWNSGILLMSISQCIDALTYAHPTVMRACREAIGKGRYNRNRFHPDAIALSQASELSLHDALLAHNDRAAMVCIDMEWRDVGLRLAPRDLQPIEGHHAWH